MSLTAVKQKLDWAGVESWYGVAGGQYVLFAKLQGAVKVYWEGDKY